MLGNLKMDLFSMIRLYLIILFAFFMYMYNYNKDWYTNKFIYYSTTVYIPFFIFTMVLLKF
jgi:hypothetical protein